MEVKITRGTIAGGKPVLPGAVVDLSETEARSLVAMNKAEIVTEDEASSRRVFCHVDGCQKYKTAPCEDCGEFTCESHMDLDSGVCVVCQAKNGADENTPGGTEQ